jgi:hypothetical protein
MQAKEEKHQEVGDKQRCYYIFSLFVPEDENST